MKQSEVTLRPANAGDVTGLYTLFQQAVLSIDDDIYSREQRELWANRVTFTEWQQKLETLIILIAEQEEEMAGLCAWNNALGYIDLLYVSPAFQGKGIASLLLHQALSQCQQGHVYARASLCSLPVFLKQGFQDLGRAHSIRDGVLIPYHQVIAYHFHIPFSRHLPTELKQNVL